MSAQRLTNYHETVSEVIPLAFPIQALIHHTRSDLTSMDYYYVIFLPRPWHKGLLKARPGEGSEAWPPADDRS